MMNPRIVFFLVFIFLCSCDVPGWIIIKNKSGGKAVYRYEIIGEGDSLKTVTYELEVDRDHDEVNMMFGFGHFWNDEVIEKYLQTVNKIEIISPRDTLLLSDKKEMFDFFRKRRRGLFRQTIVIKIR